MIISCVSVALSFFGCTTVPTENSSQAQSNASATALSDAIKAYNTGFYLQSEVMFSDLLGSSSLAYDEQDLVEVYWIATNGRLLNIEKLNAYLDSNYISVPELSENGLHLDLGFDVSQISNWKCYELETSGSAAAANCWVANGYVPRAKTLIKNATIDTFIQSKIIP